MRIMVTEGKEQTTARLMKTEPDNPASVVLYLNLFLEEDGG